MKKITTLLCALLCSLLPPHGGAAQTLTLSLDATAAGSGKFAAGEIHREATAKGLTLGTTPIQKQNARTSLGSLPGISSPFMGCYGDEINRGHTPQIDKLASGGVLFKRADATRISVAPI
jgi:hypothetical protein